MPVHSRGLAMLLSLPMSAWEGGQPGWVIPIPWTPCAVWHGSPVLLCVGFAAAAGEIRDVAAAVSTREISQLSTREISQLSTRASGTGFSDGPSAVGCSWELMVLTGAGDAPEGWRDPRGGGVESVLGCPRALPVTQAAAGTLRCWEGGGCSMAELGSEGGVWIGPLLRFGRPGWDNLRQRGQNKTHVETWLVLGLCPWGIGSLPCPVIMGTVLIVPPGDGGTSPAVTVRAKAGWWHWVTLLSP